jgi:1-hydroxy-2-methyl-2-(E)-butenyl 4-diphosphate synthase
MADIHFHYKRAIEAAENGASCLRINPGNIGSLEKVQDVIKAAKNNNCSIRIGVNGGSLEKKILEKYSEPNPDALIESALNNIKILEDNDFFNFKISVKSSDIFMAIEAYKGLAELCDYPLHLGITEAGGKRAGSIKSSIGMGNLLLNGIGDTIRVSLSDDPEEEVRVGFEILKSLGIRNRGVKIISCPSCARQQFQVIDLVKKLEKSLEDVKESITVSIIGCVVNGPGEANMTNIGITGGGNNTHMIYIDGKKDHIVKDENLAFYLDDIIRKKVKKSSI